MQTKSTLSLLAAALVAATALVGQASAHAPKNPALVGDIAKMSAASALVFHGKVLKIDYKLSTGPGNTELPYTFVTYRVDKVLQGATMGKTLTLRFAGGTDGRGGFVDAEGVPTFQEGDEDVLFVQGNGEEGCPLVQCEFGRYRVLNNQMFEAHGSPVVGIKNGKIVAHGNAPAAFQQVSFPTPSFDEIMKRPEARQMLKAAGLTMAQARARYQAQAPKRITIKYDDPMVETTANAKAAEGLTQTLDVDGFESALSQQMRPLSAGQVKPLASFRVNQALTTPVAAPVKPPVVPRFANGAKSGAATEQPITKN